MGEQDGQKAAGADMTATSGTRLMSIDAFRGFDMMMIMGFNAMMIALGKWMYGGDGGWLANQFRHPEWFGLSFYDTIFPTFLFIAGLSFPFSHAKDVARGATSLQMHGKIFRRAALLVMLGWVVNGVFKVGFAELRYGSVLAKIGLGWMFAALAYIHFGRMARIALCAALIIGYAVLPGTVVAPDYPNASSLSIEGNFIGWLDRMTMPGTLWQGTVINGQQVKNLCEPSGLYANFFASATAMLGCFAGEIVRSARSGARKTVHLLMLAAGLLLAGAVMTVWMPISKKLWSPSFILCVGAYSTALFALFYWLVDVLKWRWWTPFFTVIGMNAITIYLLQRIVDYKKISHFFLGGVAAHLPPAAGELLLATGYFAACWLTLYFLYRKRTFLKV